MRLLGANVGPQTLRAAHENKKCKNNIEITVLLAIHSADPNLTIRRRLFFNEVNNERVRPMSLLLRSMCS